MHLRIFHIIPILFLVSACNSEIPDNLATVINSFLIDKAILNDTVCDLAYTEYHYDIIKEQEVLTYYNKVNIQFDSSSEENYYYYIRIESLENGNLTINEKLANFKGNNTYILETNNNGEYSSNIIDKSRMEDDLTKFYYNEVTSDYYSGGLYFGDEFKINYREYTYMSIDKEGFLNYNLPFTQFDNLPFIQKISYKVDNYGMVVNLDQEIQEYDDSNLFDAEYIRKNTYLLNANYNCDINKITTLK